MEKKIEMAIEYCCGAFNRECFQPGVVNKVQLIFGQSPSDSPPSTLMWLPAIPAATRLGIGLGIVDI